MPSCQERSTVKVNCCLPPGRRLSSNYILQRHIVSNMTSIIQFNAGGEKDERLLFFCMWFITRALSERPFYTVHACPPQGLLNTPCKKPRRITLFFLFFLMTALNCHCDSGNVTTATQRTDGRGSCFSRVDSLKAAHGSDSSFMAQDIIHWKHPSEDGHKRMDLVSNFTEWGCGV